jgi:hypothetical protein
VHDFRCKEQWRRIVCTRSILIEHRDNIILSNFCLAVNHEETEINYTCDKTTLHRLICTRGTRKDKICSRHKWFGRSKCPDTDTDTNLHEARACAQRMCPMKSTCWPYPNEYCETLTISNRYLHARQCPNNALFTGTWNMLAKEAVQCAGACAAHYIASFPFDNLTPTRPTLACLTLETIL